MPTAMLSRTDTVTCAPNNRRWETPTRNFAHVALCRSTFRATLSLVRQYRRGIAVAVVLFPSTALAHDVGATPADVWHHWGASASELALILLTTLWYVAGVRALWRHAGRGRGVSSGAVAAFLAGVVTLLVTLASPLDALAESLFSAHMVQHLLLMMVAAPLWILGAPLLPLLFALPLGRRHALGVLWNRATSARQLLRFLTSPGSALVMSTAALWVWHFPGPYQRALETPWVHAIEHFSFFGSALLFWWAVLQPVGRRRTSHAVALLLVVAALMESGALGALLMFANAPWYPAHAAGASAWNVDLLEDQQLAGLIMWIPSAAIYVAAAAWLFLRWMQDDARRSLGSPRARPAVTLAPPRVP